MSGYTWFDISFEEAIRDHSHNQVQENKWKNAVADGRAHVSDREYKRVKKTEFLDSISIYYLVEQLLQLSHQKSSMLSKVNYDILRIIIDYAYPACGPYVTHIVNRHSIERKVPVFNNKIRICIRKRPIVQMELMDGEYHSLFARNEPNNINQVAIHDGRIARSGKRMSMKTSHYLFNKVFNENSSNADVCRSEVEPLLSWIKQGNDATLILFGQTGTGKTYTLSGVLEYLSGNLMNRNISLTFIELFGKKCYDLLEDRKEVKILSSSDDKVHIRGAKSVSFQLTDNKQLIEFMNDSLKLRSSEVTERNASSSRSHAIADIQIMDDDGVTAGGRIRLVDLAGSERNYETVAMTASKHRESADINMSLMALKDCIRIYHTTKQQKQCSGVGGKENQCRMPFRANLLTRLLRECFIDVNSFDSSHANDDKKLLKEHKTALIATVSPTPSDLIHSINTIDHVTMMSDQFTAYNTSVTVEVPSQGLPMSNVPVEQWTAKEVDVWLSQAEDGKFSNLVLPNGTDGRMLMSLNLANLSAICEGTMRTSRMHATEGSAWVMEADSHNRGHSALGKSLYMSLRRVTKQANESKL